MKLTTGTGRFPVANFNCNVLYCGCNTKHELPESGPDGGLYRNGSDDESPHNPYNERVTLL